MVNIDKKQEYLIKLQSFEQQANQLGEQFQAVEQQINELDKLKEDLNGLKNSAEKEVYTDFGKGIFVKAKLDKEDLLVDVGDKVFVPKSFEDISETIDVQKKKFEEVKDNIGKNIEEINKKVNELINSEHLNEK